MPKTTKKPASRATTATKVTKSATHKGATAKHAKASTIRSFRLSSEAKPFMTVSPSVQSFYWLIIGILILLLAAWAMYLTVQIQTIYDTIGSSDSSSMITPMK